MYIHTRTHTQSFYLEFPNLWYTVSSQGYFVENKSLDEKQARAPAG
jgi:hypothetical protein